MLSPEWVPTVNMAIGAVVTLLATVATQLFINTREREARKAEAQTRREHQWADFQMRTLLGLQGALIRMTEMAVKASATAHGYTLGRMADEDVYRAAEEFHRAQIRALARASRVEDEDARRLAEQVCALAADLKDFGASQIEARTFDQSAERKHVLVMYRRLVDTIKRAGELVRGLHTK